MSGLPTWAAGYEWGWECPVCESTWQDQRLADGETVTCLAHECETKFEVTLRLTPISEGDSR